MYQNFRITSVRVCLRVGGPEYTGDCRQDENRLLRVPPYRLEVSFE